jgi:hypothetical protein
MSITVNNSWWISYGFWRNPLHLPASSSSAWPAMLNPLDSRTFAAGFIFSRPL